jgi:hypothetical protein
MKIRFHNNSVRVRLTQTEVAQLGAGARIEQVTAFSPMVKFVCSIGPCDRAKSANATFHDKCVIITLPKTQTVHWATGDDVGIESHQLIGNDESLHLLIEKDFACLHSVGEQTPDTFPNPFA